MLFVCIRPIFTNLCPLFPSWNTIVPNINRALIKLSIGDSELGHGIQTICESLCHNDTLQAISFANRWGNAQFKMGAAGAKRVADMLKVNRSLTSLNLRWNEIGAGGAKAIADSLPQS